MKAMIQAHAAVRRMAMSVVALHVVARVVDYYITKIRSEAHEATAESCDTVSPSGSNALSLKRNRSKRQQQQLAPLNNMPVRRRT